MNRFSQLSLRSCALIAALGFSLEGKLFGQEAEPTPIQVAEVSEVDTSVPLPSAETSVPALPASAAEHEPIVETNGRSVAETPRRLHYIFSVVVREVYDDNVNLNRSGGGGSSDFYTSFEPRISLTLGDTSAEAYNSLQFVYSPNAVWYVENSEANAIQHVIHLEGQRVFGKLTVGLSQDVRLLDGTDLRSLSDTTGREANIDVGRRSRQNIFATKLAASYDISAKTFLSGGADYTLSDYETLISSEHFSANLFLNYHYSPKLVVGMGATGGYSETDGPTPAQYFQQVNVRLTYNPSEKLSFTGSTGFEFREFEGESRGTYTSPVYELDATYKPFDATSISVSGQRRTQSSAAIAGSDFSSTDLHFTAQQRFFQRLFFSLSTGFTISEYFSVLDGVEVDRSDNYYYFQLAFDLNITRFWNAGLYYLHREDLSSAEAFSFSNNQIGLRTSLTF